MNFLNQNQLSLQFYIYFTTFIYNTRLFFIFANNGDSEQYL